MSTNTAIQKLAHRVIRAEIAARHAKDVQQVEDEISTRIRIGTEGDILVVDKFGAPIPTKSFEAFLDDVAKDRPELFGWPASAGSPDNPFKRGSSWNVSRQMQLIKSDPELATHLAADAGVNLRKGL